MSHGSQSVNYSSERSERELRLSPSTGDDSARRVDEEAMSHVPCHRNTVGRCTNVESNRFDRTEGESRIFRAVLAEFLVL